VIIRKSTREIEKIAAAGAVVADTIAHVGALLTPGVTTEELDTAARTFIRERGGIPTSEGYKGYPKAICISTNDVVVHGIPDGFVVSEGDLVTIDVGVTLDGYIADSAYTFGVGEIEPESQNLLNAAQDALAAGISEAVVGNRWGHVPAARQAAVEGARVPGGSRRGSPARARRGSTDRAGSAPSRRGTPCSSRARPASCPSRPRCRPPARSRRCSRRSRRTSRRCAA